MDNRFQWPPQEHQNGQYAAPSSSPRYPQNGYAIPNSTPQMTPHGYVQRPPPIQEHPIVVIPRKSPQELQQYQQYDQIRVQPYVSKPQVVIPSQKTTPQHRSNSYQPHQPQQRAQPQQRPHSYQEQPPSRTLPQTQHRPQPQHQRTPQTPNHPKVVIKKPVPKPSPTVSNVSSTPKPSNVPPTDYSVLLLSMAEEYIRAAHGMGPLVVLAQRQADLQRYYKLISTGLGCMESVLKNFRLHPRMEAGLRLRYAGLLGEETENYMEAETVLSKGITICQRSRLLDLKYSMQHLLARILFKTNHRAALKSLENAISEAETCQHVAWVYALRFLRVSLSLQIPSHPEISSAIQHLHAISALAAKRGDRAVYVTCAALEAMACLRNPSSENIEQAQRAIAAARSQQLQASVQELDQIVALIDCIDLSCSLQQHVPDQAARKMTALHQIMDDVLLENAHLDSGAFSVLIDKSSGGDLTSSSAGIFKRRADGRDEITFSWLHKRDLYTLGYYLSGVTSNMRNEERAINYFTGGISLIRGIHPLVRHRTMRITDQILASLDIHKPAPESIPASLARNSWGIALDWHMRFTMAFLHSQHSDWAAAEKVMLSLGEQVSRPPFDKSDTSNRLVTYLAGIIEQGKGNTDSALTTYQSPLLALPESNARSSDFKTELAILSSINQVFLIRNPTHPNHFMLDLLLAQLEPLCHNHPNRAIVIAFNLVKAITNKRTSITEMKTVITNALQTAKSIDNNQFLAISMNLMTAWLFTNQYNEQAMKSAKAGVALAKRAKSPLWLTVADGLLHERLVYHGKMEEAEITRRDIEMQVARLPVRIREG